ncbi:hypothetical protein PR048_015699 [Dryococelus australis]|uniref:Calpain catalytic domain-containing protein n=1 Tax=Dryococelus australis TaxID=614101 RepID=A0ABQ9HHN9_9NEOP|nr:hypothetical protein PR048_015699 [Dryococelus australis]
MRAEWNGTASDLGRPPPESVTHGPARHPQELVSHCKPPQEDSFEDGGNGLQERFSSPFTWTHLRLGQRIRHTVYSLEVPPEGWLYGSYEALDGGSMCEAMVDFTGGVSEHYDLVGMRQDLLLHVLLTAHHRSSMMGCAIAAAADDMEAVTKDGLVKGHAYSVTKVKVVEFKSRRTEGKAVLVRLRNPWGKIEWKGPWSDQSPEWRYVSEEEKHECGLVFDNDGEFWMSLEYLHKWFTELELCSLSYDCLATRMGRKVDENHWSMSTYEGSWVKKLTAGGCGKYPGELYSTQVRNKT